MRVLLISSEFTSASSVAQAPKHYRRDRLRDEPSSTLVSVAGRNEILVYISDQGVWKTAFSSPRRRANCASRSSFQSSLSMARRGAAKLPHGSIGRPRTHCVFRRGSGPRLVLLMFGPALILVSVIPNPRAVCGVRDPLSLAARRFGLRVAGTGSRRRQIPDKLGFQPKVRCHSTLLG